MQISTRGKTSLGVFHAKTNDYKVFINTTYKYARNRSFMGGDRDINKGVNLEVFLSYFLAVEFHEVGHKIGYRSGCSSAKKCKYGRCFWCNYTDIMMDWFAVKSFGLEEK